MIRVESLNKSVADKTILKDISFQIEDGECVALIGPNGAGKTTLMSCLLGDVKTTGGKEYSPELVEGIAYDDNPLTQQERLILKHIEKGLTSKEIAKALYLSDGTVRNYTSRIFSKLGVSNRMEATQKARQKDWL